MSNESKVLNVELTKSKIHFIPDVVYAQEPTFETPNQLLKLDLLVPQSNRLLPTVVFVTGGAFISANRARMPQLRFKLAEHGYVVASVTYRTVPNSHFPAPVIDVKSAIRFLKAHAKKFLIDPNRVSVVGDSAGGYLTTFAAVTNGSKQFNMGEHLDQSSEIVTAVDLYGVLDPIRLGVGFVAQKDADAANPIKYITKDSAPMLLMHGTADQIVPPVETERLFNALVEAGVEAERYLVPNAGHSDDYWVQDAVIDLVIAWLDRHNKT
ncbi:MAG: alpha/beta hydrolase [Selenomonadaceae bacterium]|nr:alpha/beta hydrolase [Selenomonadaceae bacterium]